MCVHVTVVFTHPLRKFDLTFHTRKHLVSVHINKSTSERWLRELRICQRARSTHGQKGYVCGMNLSCSGRQLCPAQSADLKASPHQVVPSYASNRPFSRRGRCLICNSSFNPVSELITVIQFSSLPQPFHLTHGRAVCLPLKATNIPSAADRTVLCVFISNQMINSCWLSEWAKYANIIYTSVCSVS